MIEYRIRPDPRLLLNRRSLRELLGRILPVLGVSESAFGLLVVGDAEMAEFNSRHLGLRGPTNVLSFASDEVGYLGDLVLSAETLAREARLYGQPPRLHTARLLAHGLLHLSGLPHGPAMDRLTAKALRAAAGAR